MINDQLFSKIKTIECVLSNVIGLNFLHDISRLANIVSYLSLFDWINICFCTRLVMFDDLVLFWWLPFSWWKGQTYYSALLSNREVQIWYEQIFEAFFIFVTTKEQKLKRIGCPRCWICCPLMPKITQVYSVFNFFYENATFYLINRAFFINFLRARNRKIMNIFFWFRDFAIFYWRSSKFFYIWFSISSFPNRSMPVFEKYDCQSSVSDRLTENFVFICYHCLIKYGFDALVQALLSTIE